MSIIQNKIPIIFFMQKNLDESSFEKRIENIEKGKSYLKNSFFLEFLILNMKNKLKIKFLEK